MLAFDTETDLMREANLAPALACITFSDGVSSELIHHADPAAKKTAEWLLGQHTTTANGSYDLAVLWAYFPDLREQVWDAVTNGRVHDVQIRQKLMDIGAGCYRFVFRKINGETKQLRYNLSDLNLRYFHQALDKDEWRLKYGMLREQPLVAWPDGAKQYAMLDALCTSRIHVAQDQAAAVAAAEAASEGKSPMHNLWDEANQVRAAWSLHLMSCWGFAVDLEQVQKVIDYIDEEQPVIAGRLRSVGLVRDTKEKKDVRNEKLAKEWMYRAVGDSGELTDTGYKKVKAGEMNKEQALQAGYIKIDEEWCEVSKSPPLIDYYHFRQNQLLRSKLTNVRTAAIWSLPIQTSFEVLLETGRTSSSENKLIRNSMALQNPPRKPIKDKNTGKVVGGVRECFIARPGHTLADCDIGQAELVSLAQVTYSAFGYSRMRDLLNAGMDIHVDFGKEVWGKTENKIISYEDAWKLYKAENEQMVDYRQTAKSADFGFPGGLGWASFQSYARKAWGVEMTGEQAKQLKRYWLDHFPEMSDYFRWIGGLCEIGGKRTAVQSFMSLRWRGRCGYTQACNNFFQSLTADATKAACFEVSRLCYTVKSSPLYGCRPLLYVHDQIIVEVPLEKAHEAAKELERVMIEVYQRFTPDVIVTATAHLMERWSKSAGALYDERGRLMPWAPPQDEDEKPEQLLVAA